MPAETWNQLTRLFAEARDLKGAERAGFLAGLRQDDPALADRLESLLGADEEDDFIADAIGGQVESILTQASDHWVGTRLGPWILREEIGRGGMGGVYLAERVDEAFEQRVAIKLLAHMLGSAESVARFLRERQILAHLSHPNICQLLDGGATDNGVPYLVMELVEGRPIHAYCDENRLTIDERLALFSQVCSAVDHAHRNLIVHRDIKPSNILVTADGVPKLLDFGIAKLLDESSPDASGALTRQDLRVMTPEYASPEQVRGQPITVASDVYSLGVLLYELLCGRHPLRGAGATPLELERAVCETEPLRPSMAAEAPGPMVGAADDASPATVVFNRRTSARELASALSGDLDNIVLTAMRKEPERRYGSAADFAADIGRHLAGLPVAAHPASWGYVTRKFVRRNALAVFGSAAMIVLLAAVISFYTFRVTAERDRAQVEAAKAAQVSSLLLDLFETANPNTSLGEVVTARSLLDQGASRIRTLDSQPEIQAAMEEVMGTAYRGLGLFDQSEILLEQSLVTRRRELGPEHPDTLKSHDLRARLMIATGDYGDAEIMYREGLALAREFAGNDSPLTASMLHGLGASLANQARYEEAEAALNEAVAIEERLGSSSSDTMAGLLEELGLVLDMSGRSEEAIVVLGESIRMHKAARGESHPAYLRAASELGWAYISVGDLDGAERVFSEVLEVSRRVYGEAHPDTVGAVASLGTVAYDRGDYVTAERLYRQSLEGFRAALGDDHPEVAIGSNNLGTTLERLGRLEEAESYYRLGLERNLAIYGPDHVETATSLSNIGVFLMRSGQMDEAGEKIREGLETRRRVLGEEHPHTLASIGIYGVYLQQIGDLDAARVHLEGAVDLRLKAHGETHPLYGFSLMTYGSLLRESGELAAAETALRKGHAIMVAAYPDGHDRIARSLLALAQVRAARGDAVDASALFTQALDQYEALVPAGHPELPRALALYGRFLTDQGQLDDGQAALERSLAVESTRWREDHWQLAEARGWLGHNLVLQGRCEAGRALLEQAYQALDASRGAEHATTREARMRLIAPCPAELARS